MSSLISACGSDSSDGPSAASVGKPEDNRPSRPIDACTAISAADVARATGKHVRPGNSLQVVKGISSCQYADPVLMVRLSTDIGDQEAARNRELQPVDELPGLGDNAYTFVDKGTASKQRVLSVTRGHAQLYLSSAELTLKQMEKLTVGGLKALPRP
ncbi:hypothetical protein ACFV2Z_32050 [Streptomyces sp. NPDC059688]|uniref:hypothetical protein n=1 Tax=Streptomyces sp. NPDC059688 TaxID=3346906 RepID=UPI0036C5F155